MKLVLVHGRAQERKNVEALKKSWLDALAYGLARANKSLPPTTVVAFPFYGDLLAELVQQVNTPLGAEILSRGANPDGTGADAEFRGEIVMQIAQSLGVTDADIQRELVGPTQKGPGNWEWVQAILRAIDRIPGVSSNAVDLFTRDVFVYLTLPGVRRKIDRVVDEALGAEPCVVVAHSLGTVVTYNVLRRRGAGGLVCPRFVTLGSPLGVKAIRDRLDTPLESPAAVGNWFNAYDERDLVALVGLDQQHFNVNPAIVNKNDVRNFTENRHGIEGYLADPVVSAKLCEFL